MYQIGDKVVYPVHGAGVVEAIESREIGGRNRQYYVLNLPYSSLRIMVPMEEAENVGLRSLMPTEAYDKVLQILEGRQEGKASPAVQAMKLEKWNNRFRMQMHSLIISLHCSQICSCSINTCKARNTIHFSNSSYLKT